MTAIQVKEKIKQSVGELPYRNTIRSVSLFGSILDDKKNPNDIDLLIDLRKKIGFFKLAAIQQKFEKILGKPVDLVTKNAMSKYFRNEVLKTAEKVYEYKER